MAGMINQLLDIMNEQAERYGELLGLSQEKRGAIVSNDIEHLQKITNLENLIVSKNQKLERKRLELMKDIAEVMGKKKEGLNLESLTKLMEGQEEHAGLVKVTAKIRTTLTELAEVNELNSSLIQNALDYIEYSINVMQTSVNQTPSTFSVKGGKIQEETGIFDARN